MDAVDAGKFMRFPGNGETVTVDGVTQELKGYYVSATAEITVRLFAHGAAVGIQVTASGLAVGEAWGIDDTTTPDQILEEQIAAIPDCIRKLREEGKL